MPLTSTTLCTPIPIRSIRIAAINKDGINIIQIHTEAKMHNRIVREQEIEAAETLSGQGDFAAALGLAQKMLKRSRDDETRLRLLFNVVGCATRLNRADITDEAVQAIEQLPNSKESRMFVDLLQAMAYIELGKASEALDLINANLNSEFVDKPNFQDWKYESLVHKGLALTRLARCEEALGTFNAAHSIQSNGKYETDMLIAQSNCLTALKRYDEAYNVASLVLSRDDEEMSTLAMQYMAECRMWQSRVAEALELYVAIQKRLPSRLVQEERIQTGIKKAMAYLEKSQPHGKPS